MDAARLHHLIERLASLFRASLRETASAHGLKLVQLEALVFLSMANRYTDTPAGLADYLGLTKGTVSQTLIALERRDLIAKVADPDDGRVWHCHLTDRGRKIVREAHPAPLLRDVPDSPLTETSVVLESLLRALQQLNGFRTFGVCHTCRFFEPARRGGVCGLTHEPLARTEIDKICREHETLSKQTDA